jgi:hypothetical protein
MHVLKIGVRDGAGRRGVQQRGIGVDEDDTRVVGEIRRDHGLQRVLRGQARRDILVVWDRGQHEHIGVAGELARFLDERKILRHNDG